MIDANRIGMLALLLFVSPAFATYNANITGVVTHVVAYTEADYILFRLANQPTSHPQCNAWYFSIPDTVPESRRKQLFAQLLAAKLSGDPVNIGYDATGECAHAYIRVHRVG